MLAWHTAEQVDRVYEKRRVRFTQRTITDQTVLHLELNRIRQRHGLAFEQGETMCGIACVGAAIRIVDGPVAAISLSSNAGDPNLKRFAPRIMEVTGEVSRALKTIANSPALLPNCPES